MPFYDFVNKKTKKKTRELLMISELDDYKVNHPELTQEILKMNMSYNGEGVKVDADFRDVLKRIKKGAGKKNTVNIPGVKK